MEKLFIKLFDKTPFAILLMLQLVFITAYQIYYTYFGLDFQDGFYHINRMISNSPYVMTFLSYKLGYFWSLLAGKSILGFRYLNVIMYLLIFFAPIILVKHKKQYLGITFLTSFSYALLNWNLIGYDSFSFLFVIFAMVALLHYFENKSNINLLIVAILSGLAIAVRLPNVLIVPLIVLVLGWDSFQYDSSFKVKKFAYFSSGVFVVFAFLLLLVYGSIPNYVKEIKLSLHATQEDHSFFDLLQGYLNHLLWIIKISFFIICFYFLYRRLKKAKWSLLYFGIGSILLLYLYANKIFDSGFNTKAALFLVSFLMVFIGVSVLSAIKEDEKNNKKILLFGTVFLGLFLPCLGSNSGLKYAGIFIVFFPFLYSKSSAEAKEYFIWILVLILPFAILEKRDIKFMDEKQSALTGVYDLPSIEGIHSTPERIQYVEEVLRECTTLQQKKIPYLLYGLNSHIFNYLIKNSESKFNTFAMKLDNVEEIRRLEFLLRKERIGVVITAPEIETTKLTIFEKKIQDLDYFRFAKKGYVVLIPKEKYDVWKKN